MFEYEFRPYKRYNVYGRWFERAHLAFLWHAARGFYLSKEVDDYGLVKFPEPVSFMPDILLYLHCDKALFGNPVDLQNL
jgi:hypothetical protein